MKRCDNGKRSVGSMVPRALGRVFGTGPGLAQTCLYARCVDSALVADTKPGRPRCAARVALGVFAVTLLALTGCKFNPAGLLPGAKALFEARKDLTPENEYYVGRAVGTQILARNEYRYLDVDGWQRDALSELTTYVNQVGNVVAAAAFDVPLAGDRPAPLAGWHFVILDDASINAFAAPGGFVFVTRGAIALAENEDELAALLAHEVAHTKRGHALGSIKKSRVSGAFKDMLQNSVELDQSQLGDLVGAFNGAMDDMLDSLLVKGYSRDTEFNADRHGLEILVKAGYHGGAFVSYLTRLSKHQATGGGGMSATHPKAAERVAQLKSHLTKLAVHELSDKRTRRFVAQKAQLSK